jgi:hypothetical protein
MRSRARSHQLEAKLSCRIDLRSASSYNIYPLTMRLGELLKSKIVYFIQSNSVNKLAKTPTNRML